MAHADLQILINVSPATCAPGIMMIERSGSISPSLIEVYE